MSWKAHSTAVQEESWRISQIRLNSDNEVEEISAQDRELARRSMTFWEGYEEHWRPIKILSRNDESNRSKFQNTAL